MAVAKSVIFNADIERSIVTLYVEYKQCVIAFVRCTGNVEPRSKCILNVATSQHISLRRCPVCQVPPIHSGTEIRLTRKFYCLANVCRNWLVGLWLPGKWQYCSTNEISIKAQGQEQALLFFQ